MCVLPRTGCALASGTREPGRPPAKEDPDGRTSDEGGDQHPHVVDLVLHTLHLSAQLLVADDLRVLLRLCRGGGHVVVRLRRGNRGLHRRRSGRDQSLDRTSSRRSRLHQSVRLNHHRTGVGLVGTSDSNGKRTEHSRHDDRERSGSRQLPTSTSVHQGPRDERRDDDAPPCEERRVVVPCVRDVSPELGGDVHVAARRDEADHDRLPVAVALQEKDGREEHGTDREVHRVVGHVAVAVVPRVRDVVPEQRDDDRHDHGQGETDAEHPLRGRLLVEALQERADQQRCREEDDARQDLVRVVLPPVLHLRRTVGEEVPDGRGDVVHLVPVVTGPRDEPASGHDDEHESQNGHHPAPGVRLHGLDCGGGLVLLHEPGDTPVREVGYGETTDRGPAVRVDLHPHLVLPVDEAVEQVSEFDGAEDDDDDGDERQQPSLEVRPHGNPFLG